MPDSKAPHRRVPRLFVEEGTKRTAIIAPDEQPQRDPQELARAREKRHKQQQVQRLAREAELAASVRRVRNAILIVLALGVVAAAGVLGRFKWNGQWPILLTWGVMAAAIVIGFGWILWYMERAD